MAKNLEHGDLGGRSVIGLIAFPFNFKQHSH